MYAFDVYPLTNIIPTSAICFETFFMDIQIIYISLDSAIRNCMHALCIKIDCQCEFVAGRKFWIVLAILWMCPLANEGTEDRLQIGMDHSLDLVMR